jgi:hypothetical protein
MAADAAKPERPCAACGSPARWRCPLCALPLCEEHDDDLSAHPDWCAEHQTWLGSDDGG